MGNLVPTAVCNLYNQGTVLFPTEHPVELRRLNGQCEAALVALDAVNHGNAELLKTFLMQQFNLPGLHERYTLYYSRDELSSPSQQLFHILPCNKVHHLATSRGVCFVLQERA